jgi:alkylhydroperoxidase/carboxymuconolactone decarboxylase family protein YurZ
LIGRDGEYPRAHHRAGVGAVGTSRSDVSIDVTEIGWIVDQLIADVPDGTGLSKFDSALVDYGIRTSVCVLDIPGARRYALDAIQRGATVAQLHEVLTLVSGLGVHSLMEATGDLVDLADGEAGQFVPELDLAKDPLWAARVGTSRYWDHFEQHVPGFLRQLRRVSASAFEGFFEIGALPNRTGLLAAKTRELISIAVDALPGHRYMPGVRLHVAGALRFGAGRREILRVVELAAQAPDPPGVRGRAIPEEPGA